MIGLIVFLIFLPLTPWLWNRRKHYYLSWKLPGPFAWPIVGNALSMRNIENNITYATEMCSKYPSPLRFWLGSKLYVFLHDADDIETVLTSSHCLNKEDAYQYVSECLAVDGLFTSEATTWKRHRKFVSPSFGLSVVYGNIPEFNKHLQNLMVLLSSYVDKNKVFDLRPIVNEATINMILETTLGLDIDKNDKSTFSNLLIQAQNIASLRMFLPWYQINWIWKMTKWPKIVKHFRELQKEMFEKLIKHKLRGRSEKSTFVDRMLTVAWDANDFSLKDVQDESGTVLMAGSDTTALTIVTAALILAMHPEKQQKAFEEIKNIVNDKNCDITRELVEKLEYTEMCLKETLRLFPMVAMVSRRNTQTLQIKGYSIPANTSIVVGIYQVHHSPEYWGTNKEEFIPERFSPELEEKRHPFCFIPFSAGPRNCIGFKYALVVMKIALAKILLHYKLLTPYTMKDIHIHMGINTNFICKHMIRLEKRE